MEFVRKYQILRHSAYVGASLWFCWLLRVNDLLLEGQFASYFVHYSILVFAQLLPLRFLHFYRDISAYLRGRQWLMIFLALSMGGGIAWIISVEGLGMFVPRSMTVFQAMTLSVLLVLDRRHFRTENGEEIELKEGRYLVYGASDYGQAIVRFLLSRRQQSVQIVAFMCEDSNLIGKKILGLPILVGRSSADLARAKEELNLDGVIICGEKSKREAKVEILESCQNLNLDVRIFDNPTSQKISLKHGPIRSVCLEDLIGSDRSARLDPMQLKEFNGKSVVITGGAGSIGREICFQILEQGAKRVYVIDHSELSLYNLKCDLSENDLSRVELLLGDTTHEHFISRTLAEAKPDIVIHAAAYKHVYLVEKNPIQAILNNVVSTKILIKLVKELNISRFVLISTDKAVRPSNAMGATKRVCELLVQIASQDTHSKSCFTIVRFGNVLGSSGSAIPHFLNQIKAGGPVTVTDKRVSRYFMTIPDAVSLVLKAIVLGNNGDLFVLKMGQPIRIYDLAVSLIRAHGLIPGKDIDIKLIGLFPGEKLSEELHHDELDILVDGFEDFSRYRHLKLESKEIVSEVDKMISLARDGSSKSLDLLEEISNSSFVKDHQKNEAA